MIFAVPESRCRRQNEVEKQKIRTALMPEGDMCLSPPWTWLVTPSCTKPGWTAEEFTLCRKVSWAAFLGQSSVSRTNLAEEKLCCFWQVSTHLCWRRQQIILGAVVSPEPLCYFDQNISSLTSSSHTCPEELQHSSVTRDFFIQTTAPLSVYGTRLSPDLQKQNAAFSDFLQKDLQNKCASFFSAWDHTAAPKYSPGDLSLLFPMTSSKPLHSS